MDTLVGIDKPVPSTAYATTSTTAGQAKGMIYATEVKRTSMYVPANNSQKPFEFYTSITDQTSRAYQLLHGSGVAYRSDGTITVNGRTAVAMGQSYGKPGDRFDIKLSSGRWMHVIIADAKRMDDTAGGAGWTGANGHVMEILVNRESLNSAVSTSGSCNVLPELNGKIIKIYKEKS